MEIINLILHYAYIVFAVVIAFGTVILFHEFGHFIVAKMNGVEVPEFALGMGPEIWGTEKGGTRYKLCLFPIGGYVRMVGEDDDEELETSTPPEKNFRNKAPWQKISIIFAGPFMNFVLAVMLFAIAFTFWGVPNREIPVPFESFSKEITISFVDSRKPGKAAGFKRYDTLLEINGQEVDKASDFQEVVKANAGKEVVVTVKRGGEILDIPVTPRHSKTLDGGEIGIHLEPPIPRTVDAVADGSPAAQAGLKTGDIILDFGRNTFLRNRFMLNSKDMELLVYRGEDKAPEKVTISGEVGQPLGADLKPLLQRLNPLAAVVEGTKECVVIVKTTLQYLVFMIKGEVSTEEVSGPVGIMQYASDFAQQSFFEFIKFFAVISISLCIVNLFPIPALDGSRIVFHFWEMIIRRPLDPKKEAIIHYVGFCFLIGLILLITYRDLKVILMKYL